MLTSRGTVYNRNSDNTMGEESLANVMLLREEEEIRRCERGKSARKKKRRVQEAFEREIRA